MVDTAGRAKLWNLESKAMLLLDHKIWQWGRTVSVGFSRDASQALIVGNQASLIEVGSGDWEVRHARDNRLHCRVENAGFDALDLQFHPDGKRIMLLDVDGNLVIWPLSPQ